MIRFYYLIVKLAALFCAVNFITSLSAHSEGYTVLSLQDASDSSLSLRAEIDLVDMMQLLPLDTDGDGKLIVAEITQQQIQIIELLQSKVALVVSNKTCQQQAQDSIRGIRSKDKSNFLVIDLQFNCSKISNDIQLQFDLFDQIDPNHRVILNTDILGITSQAVINQGVYSIDLTQKSSLQQILSFGQEGFFHILEGYDHMAFLLLLLMPMLFLVKRKKQILKVFTVVTAFTLAHSITLSLVALGKLSLPIQLAEIIIAASVIVAALFNIFKPQHQLAWKMAFLFGLIHGFGFAGALSEISASSKPSIASLFGFNLGVEIGQLLIVLLVFPILILITTKQRFKKPFIVITSIGIGFSGFLWLIQRM